MRVSKTLTAVTPRYVDNGAAGMDLYVDTAMEYELQPGQTYYLPTGIRVEIPKNYFGAIYPQYNLHKKGLALADAVTVLSSSYRGEIVLAVKNIFCDVIRINGQWGLRIPLAQLIIQPYRFEKIDTVEIEGDAIDVSEFARQTMLGLKEGFENGALKSTPIWDGEKMQGLCISAQENPTL
jgi:dUTP pyrophosphatase